jgi:hypothetical protein
MKEGVTRKRKEVGIDRGGQWCLQTKMYYRTFRFHCLFRITKRFAFTSTTTTVQVEMMVLWLPK